MLYNKNTWHLHGISHHRAVQKLLLMLHVNLLKLALDTSCGCLNGSWDIKGLYSSLSGDKAGKCMMGRAPKCPRKPQGTWAGGSCRALAHARCLHGEQMLQNVFWVRLSPRCAAVPLQGVKSKLLSMEDALNSNSAWGQKCCSGAA